MKTAQDIVDILWDHINNSSLKTAINGVVCKKRPAGSKKEDVVINALPVPNFDLQKGIANVNIYAPNKPQKFNGITDNSQPDFSRLKALTAIAVQLLTDKWSGDYHFTIEQVSNPIEDEGDQHYINIRVEFYSINILN